MNKLRRYELKMLHYKKRLKNIRAYSEKLLKEPIGVHDGIHYNYSAFRSHGAPCSCIVCSHRKYNRAKTKRNPYYLQAEQDLHI